MVADYSTRNPELAELYPAHIREICTRHDHALEQAGAAHAVIFSGNPLYAFLDDLAYPFVPNPHFRAWAPVAPPLSYIVYTPGQTPVMIYNQPRDYWHVVPEAPDGFWAGQFDIRVVHDIADAVTHLPESLDNCVLLGDIDDPAHAAGIERVNPTVAINILHFARARKTAYELQCMRLANERAVCGHLAAAAAFAAGEAEFDIHRAYCAATSHTDSELPYPNIVAVNDHAAVLHYTDLDRLPPVESRSLVIDAGASVLGYAADITRTYGSADARYAALIARMDQLQLDVVARVGPGVSYSDLHVETHRLLADVLVEFDLASGDPDTLLTSGVTSAFLPHGLGHLLGVQVHDVGGHMQDETGLIKDPPGGHPYLRLTRVLEEDMVVTIEPGLYVIDLLLDELRDTPAGQHVNWDTVDWLRPFGGIRIEDNVRVVAGGRENLTRDAFANAA